MENRPAKTLVKVKESKFDEACDFFRDHDITVANIAQDRIGEPIYMSLSAPKGHLEPLYNELEPLILGNISGC